MSGEFSRRVDVELFKDEPLTFDEWVIRGEHLIIDRPQTEDQVQAKYRQYLDSFQPYWWHAQSPNGEIVTNGEHYANEAGAINSVEVLFGDDTTMYWAREYGEDHGDKWLRFGRTDREHQEQAALSLLDGTTKFMRATGQMDFAPTFADQKIRDLRVDLISEEMSEYLNAEGADDRVEMVDGLLDVIVIAWGSLLAYVGEDKARAAAAEVVRSNLDKIGLDGKCVKRDDGKILKPEGWQPPDIAGAIA